jgi:hypothetical protein
MPPSYFGCSCTEWINKRFGLLIYYTGIVLRQSDGGYNGKQDYDDDIRIITRIIIFQRDT